MFVKRMIAQRTPLYRAALDVRAKCDYIKIRKTRSAANRVTHYCISPYKTATTYVSNIFSEYRVAHEPLHYVTLRHIDDVKFLRRRRAYLDLDLECTGAFCESIPIMREAFPEARFLFIIRHPQSWIQSTLNYYENFFPGINYIYLSSLFYKKHGVANVDRFFQIDEESRVRTVKSLLEMWLRVYQAARRDTNSLIIKLEEIDSRLGDIESFLGMKSANAERAWRHKGKLTQKISLADYVDLDPYRADVAELGYEL